MPEISMGPITVTRCQPHIGAEIGGVDLTKPLPADVLAALKQAILKYQVVVLRDQDITRDQHLDLARSLSRNPEKPFGYLSQHSNPVEGYPEILRVVADGKIKTAVDIWHTDDSVMEVPCDLSILRARIVPSIGGDTVFSSCVAIYRDLPDELKAKIRDLKAWHGSGYARNAASSASKGGLLGNKPIERPNVQQPVVRIHPETGLPVMYYHELAGPFIGLSDEESLELRRTLTDMVKRNDYQMRVKWRPNTITIWDNRSVQHYACGDYNEPRDMERVTVAGLEKCFSFADLEADADLKAKVPQVA